MATMIEDWSKLTNAEQRHLTTVMHVTTTDELIRTFAYQKGLRDSGRIEPCWACKHIARKLGYET